MAMAVVMALGLSACGGSNSAASSSAAGSVSGSASGSVSNGDPAFTTVTPGKLTMSTNAPFPPYEVGAGDGSFACIAQKLGLELQVDDMGFDACLQAAQTGKSDIVMAGVTVTEERQAVMDFSNTYANGVQVVIVKEGSPHQTVDALANANMIGCQMGTTGYIYCSDTPENGGFGEDHVTPYDDGAAAVQALMNGQIDAVVIDNMPAQEYVAANPGLKILDGEFTNEDYAIGVAKGNTALLDAINGALEELTNDGTIQSIVDKYISAN